MIVHGHAIECRWETMRTVNFALQQNHVPVVRNLRLHNPGPKDAANLTVSIESEPGFAAPWSRNVDVVPAGSTVDIGPVDLRLSPSFLAQLTERISGHLTVRVTGSAEIADETGTIDAAPIGSVAANGSAINVANGSTSADAHADASERTGGNERTDGEKAANAGAEESSRKSEESEKADSGGKAERDEEADSGGNAHSGGKAAHEPAGPVTLFSGTEPIDVLAFDEWSGLAILPEMIAAFVMPNHAEIVRIVRAAADILDMWDGTAAFDAYQSKDPNRVRRQAAAIFAALQNERVTYAVAPASFEPAGQRVRLPDAMFRNRLGNCLDLTVAYAACLEAVGLHPLIVFTEGHAFAGVWLVEETFAECVQDDPSLLTKRLAPGIHEICLVETTAAAAQGNQPASFEDACRLGAEQLAKAGDHVLFVDVKRTRASSIRPLPLRINAADGQEPNHSGTDQTGDRENANGSAAPELLDILEQPRETGGASQPMTKQREWERRLLDLSLRNTLLNFRATRSTIPVMCEQLGDLEDALAGGDEFQLLPMPQDWSDTPRDAELYRRVASGHPAAALLKQEFQAKRLRADLSEKDLAERVVRLYRLSRTAMEENGANTLYLALGMLRWYESGASVKPRYAPLVLVPAELVRRTSRSGIVLRARDEEPHFNVTLLEMLRQDFGIEIGGLDVLPRDDNGVDLKLIFAAIRRAVMAVPRWDVEEAAYLGLFSFSQFVMWNDLRSRAEELARNKVVASLMAGRMAWEQPETFPSPGELDDRFHPKELLVPISADSSQLAAVAAAAAGRSFVLHGPPGTGKSQTITNLIANALANGKTVLFVAEKMAALSVVQRRLESIGLGRFSLELHSNKSKKRAVLDQLRLALEAGGEKPSADWELQAERLAQTRRTLNGFVEALHRRHPFGMSLHEALIRFEAVREAPDAVAFPPGSVFALDAAQRQEREDAARELRAAAQACGHPHAHPLQEIGEFDFTPALRADAAAALGKLAERTAECADALKELRALLPLPERDGGIEALAALCEWLLAAPPGRVDALLRQDRPDDAAAVLSAVAARGVERDRLKSELLEVFAPEVLELDAPALLTAWRQAKQRWFLPRFLGERRIVRTLRAHASPQADRSRQADQHRQSDRRLQSDQGRQADPSGRPGKENAERWLSAIARYQEERRAVADGAAAVAPLVGEAAWNSGEADWTALQRLGEWTAQAPQMLAAALPDRSDRRSFAQAVADLADPDGTAFLARCGAALKRFADAGNALASAERELLALLQIDEAAWRSTGEAAGSGGAVGAAAGSGGAVGAAARLNAIAAKTAAYRANLDGLRDWCAWRRVRAKALAMGLAPLVEAYERGQLSHEEAQPAFERAWYRAFAEGAIAREEALRTFSGPLFEEQIAAFRELNERYEELTQQEIVARLSAKVPQAGAGAAVASSELGMLERAIRSGGRGVSIRRLFEQIPNVLRRLCPCMLMSPISVAQYIDPAMPPFDLVVFDEASQMPTSEAVGAMARGKDVIVVGDPKQLPPTRFFASSSGADDAEDEQTLREDMESVLDDCLALRMPQGHLLWHYRSRHESLIAFSNMQFYENKLYTFPSPLERKSNVRLVPVPHGVYDRGRTKQNRAEAEAVVAEVVRRLKDPGLRLQSIGVVTFSAVQQTLIEDLLDEAFRADPELEAAAAESGEVIFVKNLENVQGDERDVILFSIGYGPDASGKVTLNFGPLNREGGWRRLNVAVTRARQEMLVFSTLRPEQLDVSRTSAEGVAGLKAFLEYAASGTGSLALRSGAAAELRERRGIERHIAEALRRRGYEVEERVGRSGYRVDCAIVHPEQPGAYALGILCDGESYRSAAAARDRDLLRDDVLARLGWSLHRVWSLDWWDHPERETERIAAALERALARPPVKAAAHERPDGTTNPATNPATNPTGTVTQQLQQDPQGAARNEPLTAARQGLSDSAPVRRQGLTEATGPKVRIAGDGGTAENMEGLSDPGRETAPPSLDGAAAPDPDAPAYRPCELPDVGQPAEAFHSPANDRLIREQLGSVIAAEGPVCRPLLCKRVLKAWGISRSGARIEQRFDELLAQVPAVTTRHDGTVWYWPPGATPETYSVYRPGTGEDNRRDAAELPPEETAAAMRALLAAHISLHRTDLIREAARAFGYQRSGAALEKAMSAGLDLAVRRGEAAVDAQGRVTLKE